MKTISVILPVNNPEMLNEEDLLPYQSKDYCFKVTYADTSLRELNTPAEVAEVIPLVLDRIKQAEHDKASAIIVYAFGDVGIKEAKNHVSIPVMGLGKPAVHMASLLCRNYYTIIPGQLAHNVFIESLVKEENLQQKFVLASHSVSMNPSDLKYNPIALDRLIEAASLEIIEKNIDTFTLGCASFIGVAKPLQNELRKHYKKPITVIDLVEVSLKVAIALC